MEQQDVQQEEGISLVDIFRLLLSKIKLLILVLLIGGVLGGVFAVWKTIDINYYGTTVEFYVNPEKSKDNVSGTESQYGVYGAYGRHVMDNMIKLLGSESFTEKMILNSKSLPEKDKWVNTESETEVALKLNDKIDAANANLDIVAEKQAALTTLLTEKSVRTIALTTANELLNEEWKNLYYDSTSEITSATFDEVTYLKHIRFKTEDIYTTLHTLYADREEKQAAIDELAPSIELAQNEKNTAQAAAELTTETALEAWRQTALYKSTLSLYKDAISFSYLQSNEDIDDANNLARSFIYVSISVLQDQDFAKSLLERVKTVVPAYVEENMTVPQGYEGTNCQRITRTDDIALTNPRYTTNQAIKYGALAGIAALVVTCLIVILVDKSDKRLRDTEIITKKFNVPLLGIVPSIEELKSEQHGKKKAEKKDSEVK